MRLTETQRKIMDEISDIPELAEYCRKEMAKCKPGELDSFLRKCLQALYDQEND